VLAEFAQLLTDGLDMRINRPQLNGSSDGLPYQFTPVEGAAGMSGQRSEHSKLGARQSELLPAEPDGKTICY
jgi:hypothetical protein